MAKLNYDWALNPVKLEQAVAALEKKKLLDSKVEISEETIKEEYIARAGRVRPTKEGASSEEGVGSTAEDVAPTAGRRVRRASSEE